MPEYTVKQGDCLSSIAFSHGLFWETVWNHPLNAELRERRQDPNVLQPGDVIFLAEKEQKEESGATEQRHRFRLKGTPVKLRLRVMQEPEAIQSHERPTVEQEATTSHSEDPQVESEEVEEQPRSNIPYVLMIDGQRYEGNTDEDGLIEVNIPPNARNGRLMLEPGTPNETLIQLKLGTLNPLGETSGVKQRLANLGFDCGETAEEETPVLQAALRAFQHKHGLEVTSEADQATRAKLMEQHQS